MAWLDDIGLGQLWDRISSVFARKTEAGGSLGWDGSNLTLNSVAGGSLGSVDLNNGLATDSQAGHSLGKNGTTITLTAVDNTPLTGVDISSMLSGATSGLVSETSAVGNITISGKTMTLWNAKGQRMKDITLP